MVRNNGKVLLIGVFIAAALLGVVPSSVELPLWLVVAWLMNRSAQRGSPWFSPRMVAVLAGGILASALPFEGVAGLAAAAAAGVCITLGGTARADRAILVAATVASPILLSQPGCIGSSPLAMAITDPLDRAALLLMVCWIGTAGGVVLVVSAMRPPQVPMVDLIWPVLAVWIVAVSVLMATSWSGAVVRALPPGVLLLVTIAVLVAAVTGSPTAVPVLATLTWILALGGGLMVALQTGSLGCSSNALQLAYLCAAGVATRVDTRAPVGSAPVSTVVRPGAPPG